ncbi:MAG: hypothetical protein HUJ97_01260 [Bacteroidales bacterium]|nr:hypothetical protein [Bacteroidales bacterium]
MFRIVLLLLFLFPFNLIAADKVSLENETLLKQLDKAIEQKNQYREARIAKADSLKKIMLNNTGEIRKEAIYSLYNIYERFKNDSALSVLNFATKLPEYKTDKAFCDYVNISLGRTLSVMGIFTDAFEHLSKVNPEDANEKNRLLYYDVQHAANGWLADFYETAAPNLANESIKKTNEYNDSIMKFEVDPIYLGLNKATKAYREGNILECIEIAKPLIDANNSILNIYVYAILAQAYEKYNDTEKEVYYLAQTAIGDITNGITEYMALHKLAQVLLKLGQDERAYDYIICALEDATYSCAKLRTLEASEIFSIIDKGHQEEIGRQKVLATWGYLSLFLLVIVLLVGIISLRRQMLKAKLYRKALAKANKKLEESYAKLQVINSGLVSADKIKQEYIIQYLNRSKKYLESLETYRIQLIKLAQGHQWDELYKKLKSNESVSEEKDRFYADFDELFLNLYPDFLDKFNALLKPEAQIVPKNTELLSTELRIFALIKLGISDSTQIAKFLSYSLATIYNYRSRIRNNAIDTTTDFETKVLEL